MVSVERLRQINDEGNWSSPYESERKDDWRPEASYTGKDCDSFASWKMRKVLIEQWDMNERSSICTCWTNPYKSEGSFHAVFVACSEGQLWVLDNAGPFCTMEKAMRRGYIFRYVPDFIQTLMVGLDMQEEVTAEFVENEWD